MNEENQISYYSIIPATIRYDNKLKSAEKLLYGEITSLTNRLGYCFASNKYFASLYDVTNHTASQWISHLEKLGYIQIELIKNDKKEIIERRIYINDTPYVQKNTYPCVLKSTYPMYQKVQDNNIKYNKDDLFILIINNSSEISKQFYLCLSKLEFIYTQEILKNMNQENIEKLKDIIFTLYSIYNSNFQNILSKIEREILINLYITCKEHNASDFLNYFKQAIINKYARM
ncbi:MAG: helix-turn-helix domain-containing protein [Clostridia bacterium]|jgi:hypothetical protein|nr:helix-turn-helix domain-containing protein [Clostridia bacterium]